MKEQLLAIVHHVRSYYYQFLPSVDQAIAQMKEPIIKEINEFIKLCTWRDVNYLTLRQTVEKSRRLISKTLRKFRKDVLEQPLTNCITNFHDDSQINNQTLVVSSEVIEEYRFSEDIMTFDVDRTGIEIVDR
jgi:midasin (ATPase involved in ribosome maturation)